MITRRDCLVGASAALVCAPAVVRAGSLMPVRNAVIPARRNYYGFCDRLWIDQRYRSGDLRGRALTRMIEEGLLQYVSREKLAADVARWGTRELSPSARRQRAEFLGMPWSPRRAEG